MTTRTSGLDKYSWIFANIFMTSLPLYTQQRVCQSQSQLAECTMHIVSQSVFKPSSGSSSLNSWVFHCNYATNCDTSALYVGMWLLSRPCTIILLSAF